MSNFNERKKERTEKYFSEIYKNKLVKCSAGSGYYDYGRNGRTPKCSSCNGTGFSRQR